MGMGPTLALAAVISAALDTPQGGSRARWLCEAARRVLGVDGVSLALLPRGGGARAVLAATDETAAALEAADDVLGMGPTYQAARSTSGVARTDTDSPAWSGLVTLFSGAPPPTWVLAVPVLNDQVVFGTMLVHAAWRESVPATEWVEEIGEAVVLMLTARPFGEWLEPALAAGEPTNQAVGILMVENDTNAGTALAMLRGRAFVAGIRLDEAARIVLDSPHRGRRAPG